ncbi:MAG: hypothetical protein ACRD0O_03865 [Acidimicrobiia bacterium]
MITDEPVRGGMPDPAFYGLSGVDRARRPPPGSSMVTERSTSRSASTA